MRRNSSPQLVLTLILTGMVVLASNASADCPSELKELIEPRGFTVDLDDTGVGSYRYTNPRRPYPLAKPDSDVDDLDKCKSLWQLAGLISDVHLATDGARFFVVTIPFELGTISSAEAGLIVADLDELLTEPEDEWDGFGISGQEPDARDELKDTLSAYGQINLEGSSIEELKRIEEDLADTESELIRTLREEENNELRDATTELFRSTYARIDGAIQDGLASTESGAGDTLALLKVFAKLSILAEATSPAAGKAISCSDELDSAGNRSCKLTLRPVPGSRVALDPRVRLFATPRLEFTVGFLDTVDSPTNATGYLRTAIGSEESDSTTKLKLDTLVGGKLDPDLVPEAEDDEDPPKQFSAENPYRGRELSRFTGIGEIQIARNLGDRADASVNIKYKGGDLGQGEDLDPTVSQYQVKVNGLSGLGLRFGRYRFARPTSGLAVSQTGEGFQFLFRGFSLGLLVRKESLDGKADFENDDSQVWIAEYKGLDTRLDWIRTGTLIGLYGEEKQVEQDYDYWTLGAEFDLGFSGTSEGQAQQPDSYWSGVLAYYVSKRDIRSQCTPDPDNPVESCLPGKLLADGKGTSALLKVSYSTISEKKNKVTASDVFTVSFGHATGDKPETEQDDGYLGENAGYGDLGAIFGAFSSKLDTDDQGQLVSGLANKQYWGVDYTTDRLSLLRGIAILLGLEKDVISSKTKISYRDIRFTEEVLGSRSAGSELLVEWTQISPAGITTSLSWGKFYPGSALEPFFESDPSQFLASVKVTIK